MIFYTADLHFGHEAVIRMSNRPFQTIDEMDKTLIEIWNGTIREDDTVYILGDFAYRNKRPFVHYLKQLKGKKHLILGNHDRNMVNKVKMDEHFETVEHMTMVEDGDKKIVLCHYPLAEWSGYFKGWYHAYGHIHNAKNDAFHYMKTKEKAVNAGVDINNFKPVTLKEMITNNKLFKEL